MSEAEFGGTQLWEQEIINFCQTYMGMCLRPPLGPRERADVIESFRGEITSRFCSPKPGRMLLAYRSVDRKRTHTIGLSEEMAERCFSRSLDEALRLGESKIAEATRSNRHVRVVLSGGSSLNLAVQARLRKVCEEAGLPRPILWYKTIRCDESVNPIPSAPC